MKLAHKRIFLACAILAGIAWGALRLVFLDDAVLAELVASLHSFAANFGYANFGLSNIGASLFRHGHLLLLVWLCALMPKLSWAAYPLLYLRAMTVTFSLSLMIQAFGWQGLFMSLVLNIPQNVLTMGMAGYTILKVSPQNRHTFAFLCISAVLIASLYEVFVAPVLFSSISS